MAIYDFSISSICKYNLSQHFISIDNTKYIYMDLTIHCTQFSFWSFYLNIESLCAYRRGYCKKKVTNDDKTRILLSLSQNDVCRAQATNFLQLSKTLCVCIKAGLNAGQYPSFSVCNLPIWKFICQLKYIGDMCAIIPFFTILVALSTAQMTNCYVNVTLQFNLQILICNRICNLQNMIATWVY